MRGLIAFVLAIPCFAQGPVYTTGNFASQYSGGPTNSFSVTATGANLNCVVKNVYRATGSSGTPTCGGNAMTKVGSVGYTTGGGGCFTGTSDTWYYGGAGLSAGSITIAVPSVVFESQAQAFIFSNAGTSYDAIAPLFSGTSSGIPGGSTASMPITTIANNALVLGEYCPASGTFATTPSPNAIYIGVDSTGFGLKYWVSSPNVTPAGSFILLAKSAQGAGLTYQSSGISIAPPASTYQQKAKALGFGH